MLNLYHEIIMDHYQKPRNRGAIKDADFTMGRYNAACGDAVSMFGKLNDGQLSACSFEGKGCVISQATASLLTEKSKGMSVRDIQALDSDAILALLGITLGPTRLRCALLPLEALQEGVKTFIQ